MINNILQMKTPREIGQDVALRVRKRRKEANITQAELGKKANVSLGSIKRFESTGEISLHSLIKISGALECEQDFEELFHKKHYNSIQEVIDDQL